MRRYEYPARDPDPAGPFNEAAFSNRAEQQQHVALRRLFVAMVRWAEASSFPLLVPWRPLTVRHRKLEIASLAEGIDQDLWSAAHERQRIRRLAVEMKTLGVSTRAQLRARLPLTIAVMAARWLKEHFHSAGSGERELRGILPGQAGLIAGIVLDEEPVPGPRVYERLRYEGREKLRKTVRDSRS